jgi:nucleoside-diphosphate-sugar epimerase
MTRSGRAHYATAPEWGQVVHVAVDREQEDKEGTFGRTVLAQKPDAVIDLLCFTIASATALVEALRGDVGHLLHCGSLFRYGPTVKYPIHEGGGTEAIDEYGRQKEAIARMLIAETASPGGLATTSIHPGHIVGPGWLPINPLGNTDVSAWHRISSGTPLRVPSQGGDTMHHVHADDVAQLFQLAVEHREAAAGEDFHAVAPSALTVRGYTSIVGGWFGQHGEIEPITWEQYRGETTEAFAQHSWDHLHRSHYLSIDKPKSLLGYAPAYEPEEAVLESVRWLIDHGQLEVPGPLKV